jgi:hypothetical protein
VSPPSQISSGVELAEPSAAALVEALRAVGYDASTAVADLIDNSVAAGAKNVWIRFEWAGDDSYVVLLDDGRGMSAAELREAMRPGSRNPLDARAPEDLGRFGLGLKTASFSQARRLSVATRTRSAPVSVRCWDLDHIGATNSWELLTAVPSASAPRIEHIQRMGHGTLVLWEGLDRLTARTKSSDRAAQDQFLEMIERVAAHLGMVFHRFLEGEDPRLKIYINGTSDTHHRVRPWDPFAFADFASPEETVRGASGAAKVIGYVIKHKDRLSETEFAQAAGPAGWNAQQGFYVYRNDRMLVAGSWLSLGHGREEHHKLARLALDLSNTADAEWGIDIKKATAHPPPGVRVHLRRLADAIRARARRVYARRAGYAGGAVPPVTRAWKPVKVDGRTFYRIDRDHPLVASAVAAAGAAGPAIRALLRVLEETVPVQQIWLDATEHPEQQARPLDGVSTTEIEDIIRQTLLALQRGGFSPAQAQARVASMDPFNHHADVVAAVAAGLTRGV